MPPYIYAVLCLLILNIDNLLTIRSNLSVF